MAEGRVRECGHGGQRRELYAKWGEELVDQLFRCDGCGVVGRRLG